MAAATCAITQVARADSATMCDATFAIGGTALIAPHVAMGFLGEG